MLFMYGNPVAKSREFVWEQLSSISINTKAPWLMIRDFNELTGNHKKKGGNMWAAISIVPLNHMIRNCGMLEFLCYGNQSSWRVRRNNQMIRCRLDRTLGNVD